MEQVLVENRPSEVIYQIYPSTFKDSNGDGHGDLKGITEKLGYVEDLGVDAIWISPFFQSPDGKDGDGGYAISDYRAIGKNFGTMDDFDKMLAEAHSKGLRVYTDFVLCHTSNEHEWFEKSCKREPGYENRYVWHDGYTDAGGNHYPPNNWKSCFGGSAWEWNEERGQFYLHHFANSQPALNLNETSVQDEIMKEMKFWLDKGVDGLRLDALPFANYQGPYIDKNGDPKPGFTNNTVRGGCPDDNAWEWQYFQHSMCQPQTVQFIERLRKMADSYPGHRKLLGECVAGKEGGAEAMKVAQTYLDPEKGLHSCYTTSLIQFQKYPSAQEIKNMLKESLATSPDGGIGNCASNHDFIRAATRMTEGVPTEMRGAVIRQIFALTAAMPGDMYIYNGEELGLPQADIPQDISWEDAHKIDPDKNDNNVRVRVGARAPFPSDSKEKNAGFSASDTPYLTVPESYHLRAADLLHNDPDSVLNFVRDRVKERKQNPAMNRGAMKVLDTPDPIVAFIRETEKQTLLFAFNMSGQEITLPIKSFGLDAATLKKLHMRDDGQITLEAYGDVARGLNGHGQKQSATLNTQNTSGVKRIFAADMLIASSQVPEEKGDALIKERNLKPDSRFTINAQEHERLLDATPHYTLGGSTALTMWTLKKLLQDKVAVNMMGLAADDDPGKEVKKTLSEAKINLLTPQWPDGVHQATSVSHAIRHPNGQNTLLTYPGTEAEALQKLRANNPTLVEDSIKNSDVVYLNGALIQKFGIAFVSNILQHRWKNKKELVLALPSHAEYGADDPSRLRDLINSSNVVIGSDEEFCRIYGIAKPHKKIDDNDMNSVVKPIREAFEENVLAGERRPASKEQVAFITRGRKPALLITAHKIIPVPIVEGGRVKNVLGVGEAAFAGFLAGYLKGLPHEQSATLAMKLAAEKVKQETPEPYLVDPRRTLDTLVRERKLPAAVQRAFPITQVTARSA